MSPAMAWALGPPRGGVSIPDSKRASVRQRLTAFAEERFPGQFREFDVRFRGALCYVDAYVEPELPDGWPPADHGETRDEMIARLRATPLQLCRLRFHGQGDRWSFALYSYAAERYEAAVYATGEWFGTPEDALELAMSLYLS